MSTGLQGVDSITRETALVSLRDTLAWLGDDVHYIEASVDPVLEMTAICKAYDNSKALVANNVTNYPNARLIGNLWATRERCARLFGADAFKDIKFKLLESLRDPVVPREVTEHEAPCQEMVIGANEIGPISSALPLIQHTKEDGGRFFGNGIHFLGPPWVPGNGTQFSFYRMSFRDDGPIASINMVPGGQGDNICRRWPGEKIPVTVNICPPPAIEMMGYSTFNSIVFPGFTDEIGMAGALQGGPVDIVKAKTVDAYAIAQSEMVLEGYVIEGQRVWETDEAEATGVQGEANLHPEWTRYMGKAYRTPRAFELTGDHPARRQAVLFYHRPRFGLVPGTLCVRLDLRAVRAHGTGVRPGRRDLDRAHLLGRCRGSGQEAASVGRRSAAQHHNRDHGRPSWPPAVHHRR